MPVAPELRIPVADAAAEGGDLDLYADVVVVGSGASGAVVATELAQSGMDVLVLEEGRYLPNLGAMRPTEVLRHAWRDGGMTAAIGLGDTPTINMMIGKAVGGSSLFTGGVCFRTPEVVLDEWVNVHGLTGLSPQAMEPCFDEVERALQVEEVPAHMRSRSTQLFDAGARKLGYPLKPLRRNTHGCDGCSRCNFVCPHGAKLSVDRSYLPRAVAAGARIYSQCLVDRVETSGDRAVGVSGRVVDGNENYTGRTFRVHAKRIILACGAMYTPLLLLRSGLGRGNPNIGRHMTVHPGFRVFARFDERVEGWKGALQSAYTDHFEREGLMLISIAVPPGVLSAVMSGAGPDHRERSLAVPNIAMFGGMLHDDPGGRVRVGIGREPLVTYRMSKRDRARVPRLIKLLGETFLAAGAKEIYLPILGLPAVSADDFGRLDLDHIHGRHFESASQHPLGTCRMGTSPKTSVVDPEGQVWGVRELYVVDGSITPTSLGVNPQISIMALATRIAWRLRETPFAH